MKKVKKKLITLVSFLAALGITGCAGMISSQMMSEQYMGESVEASVEEKSATEESSEEESKEPSTEEATEAEEPEEPEVKDERAPECSIDTDKTGYSEDYIYEEEGQVKRELIYLNHDLKAKLSIKEENLDLTKSKVYVQRAGKGKTEKEAVWSLREEEREEDGETITDKYYDAELTIKAEEYENEIIRILLEAEDMSGNKSKAESPFYTFDITAPKLTTSLDRERAISVEDNTLYFDKEVSVNVLAEDRNLLKDSMEVKVTKDGQESVGKETDITLTEDGSYRVWAQVRDKAGNVTEAEVPETIVVDTLIDKNILTVNGEGTAGRSFGGDVSPVMEFGDKNLDSYEVSMTQDKFTGTVDVGDVYIKEINVDKGFGQAVFSGFPRTREADGRYTLTLTLRDKAGHSSTQTVVFTVNRFGSEFTYDDYVKELSADGRVIKEPEKNLVLKEINPTQTVKSSIVITRDGKPLEDPAITTETSRVNSWWESSYTIDKSTFGEDGVYKISVLTLDETGNVNRPEGDDGGTVTFAIDKSAPEITHISWVRKDGYIYFNYGVKEIYGISEIRVYKNKILFDIQNGTQNEGAYAEESIRIEDEQEDIEIALAATDLAGNTTEVNTLIPKYLKENIKDEEENIFYGDYETPMEVMDEAEMPENRAFPIGMAVAGGAGILTALSFLLKKFIKCL